MLYEGTRDFQATFVAYGFQGYEPVLEAAKTKAIPKYLPVYEKVLKENGSTGYLVGSKLTLADVGLLEPLLWVEEFLAAELSAYPEVQVVFKFES
jgi:glutathione S-transferase